ncbi:MAG: YkgJ family cysteine cluster protein [Chitinispirillales bacterium]|nr:YkgJ family cysteine cluster protein [Chitinispirillales bacterium]
MTNRCKKCDAYCCRHVAIGIDTPSCEEDFDHIRWYLRHKNIWVSIDFDGNWIVEFKTPCRSIAADYKCADYKNRPQICKDYPGEDMCEGETDEPSYTELFKNVGEFEEYLGRL